MFDACGMAGGVSVEMFNAAAYNLTKFAKQGDLGTAVLKPRPTGTVWKRGGTAKARWQITANHGGGKYSELRRHVCDAHMIFSLSQDTASASVQHQSR